MRKVLAIIGLGLLTSSFALDEYLSVETGKLEVDGGYMYQSLTGRYDKDGKKQDFIGDISPAASQFGLQLKYGAIPDLDIELAIMGIKSNKDAGKQGGLSQPELAVKYTHKPLGLGGFVNVILPFVTGNLDRTEPALGLAAGAVYGNRFGNFRMTGIAGYQLNFENKDKLKQGNTFYIYAKPEAMWTEFIGTYLGLKYQLGGESSFDGTSLKDSGKNLFTVLPGINAVLLPWLAYEVNVPVTLFGKNVSSGWGIAAIVRATLPK